MKSPITALFVGVALAATGSFVQAAEEWLLISNRSGVPQLYVHGEGSSGARQLGPVGQAVFESRWSPDGRRIAYVAAAGRTAQIFVADVATGAVQALTTGDHLNDSPRWSPDGRHIAFVSQRDGNPEVYRMAADGSAQTRLTDHPEDDTAPTWSPDGRQIAFLRNVKRRDVFVMNSDGSVVRNLTNTPNDEDEPVWAPDGSRLLYVARRREVAELRSVAPDGSDGRTLIGNAALHSLSFSPDGQQMAFISNAGGTPGNLWVARADGSQARRISNSPMDDLSPQWATDGRQIYFISMRNVRPMLFRVAPDGSNLVTLSSGPGQDIQPLVRPVPPAHRTAGLAATPGRVEQPAPPGKPQQEKTP